MSNNDANLQLNQQRFWESGQSLTVDLASQEIFLEPAVIIIYNDEQID